MSRTNNVKFMRFAVISNICLEPYFRQYLDEIYECRTNIVNIPLSELKDVDYNETVINADCIIILISLKERFPSLIDNVRTEVFSLNDILNVMEMECKTIAEYLVDKSNAPIFWFSFEDYGIYESEIFGSIPVAKSICGKLNEMLYNNLNNSHIIESLQMKIEIHLSNEFELNRISELTQRSNKYTNGMRYSYNELKNMIRAFCSHSFSHALLCKV